MSWAGGFFICLFALVTTVAAAPAHAVRTDDAAIAATAYTGGLPDGVVLTPQQKASLRFRRTLYAPAGQRTLLLEAPLGMCFLDPSVYPARFVYEGFRQTVGDANAGQLLAIFTPCLDGASFAQGGGTLTTLGLVTWLNPQVGETTPLSLDAYLDRAEKEIHALMRLTVSPGAKDDAWKDVLENVLDDLSEGDKDEVPANKEKAPGLSPATAINEVMSNTTTGKPGLDKALAEVSGLPTPPLPPAVAEAPQTADVPAKEKARAGVWTFDPADDAYYNGAMERLATSSSGGSVTAAPSGKRIWTFDKADDAYYNGAMERLATSSAGAVPAAPAVKKEDPASPEGAAALVMAASPAQTGAVLDYRAEAKARRSAAGVSVGYTATVGDNTEKTYLAGIVGTTVLQHVPVAVILNRSQKAASDAAPDKLRALMDVFLAQQVALNR